MLDGDDAALRGVLDVVQNLQAAGKIPSSHVLLLGNSNFREEEILMDPTRYAQFVMEELLPWAYPDSSSCELCLWGTSLSGLVVLYMLLLFACRIERAILQSPSAYVEGERIARLLSLSRTEDYRLHVYLSYGLYESPNTAACRHLTDVFQALACSRDITITENVFAGGHDALWWAYEQEKALLSVFSAKK